MNKYLKELALWVFIALPYIYLATIWNELPRQVPVHFNFKGFADGWSDKSTFLIIPGALGIGIYLIMLMIPFLDPKRKIQQMEDKYYAIRFILTIFISFIAIYIVYTGKTGNFKTNILFGIIGALFAMLGNYIQTVRPNYFLGIRTPWTLENEQVWKSTHRFGGRLWTAGGLLIVILAFFSNNNVLFSIIFGVILFLMIIVTVVYSYTEFRKIKNMKQTI